MKLLLHACCGPCTIVPLRMLREEGADVTALFFNPNIHPYLEYRRRLEALLTYGAAESLTVLHDEAYPAELFFRAVAFSEADRCGRCYAIRLEYAAMLARSGGFDAFTTTLLYSKYQKHDLIRAAGEAAANHAGIPFLYRDFRPGWSEGVKKSKEIGMYRQQYCGCLFSERDRYGGSSGLSVS